MIKKLYKNYIHWLCTNREYLDSLHEELIELDSTAIQDAVEIQKEIRRIKKHYHGTLNRRQ